ncbi:hypothetical protein [Candidatus Symbiopectobacterium sp.]|nr:hypothetical protein [Candidatus Symbiopectobacterium sp.]
MVICSDDYPKVLFTQQSPLSVLLSRYGYYPCRRASSLMPGI